MSPNAFAWLLGSPRATDGEVLGMCPPLPHVGMGKGKPGGSWDPRSLPSRKHLVWPGESHSLALFPPSFFSRKKKKSSREQEVTGCCGVLGRAEPSAWTSPSQGKQLGQETPQKPVPMIPPWIVPPARQASPPAPTQSLTSHFPLLKTRMGGRSRRAAFLLCLFYHPAAAFGALGLQPCEAEPFLAG